MSRESYSWLAENVLAGFAETRRPWWATVAEREGNALNLFPAEVPMERVEELLTSWSPYTESLYTGDMEEVKSHKLVRADDTKEIMAVVGIDHAIHSYKDWLTGTVRECVGDEAQVSSAGLLRRRAQAWVQIERPETATGPDGIMFSPYVTLSTSLDGSLASQINQNTQMVICHAPGTTIIDGEWRGLVEEHPSFRCTVRTEGKEIRVKGLPFAEQVSNAHRYWVRERKRSLTPKMREKLGTTRSSTGTDLDPAWVYADSLRPAVHEIGYPIDMTVKQVPFDTISDLESAWILGYAWGNGHLGKGHSVTLSVPSARQDLIDRISAYAKANGWSGKPAVKQGCVQITFSHPELRRAFGWFYTQGEAWGQKRPPQFTEKAPLEWQRWLVQGYYAADGNVDTTEGCILLSVSLDGLLSLRRILMRLGIPSGIRRGSDPSLRSVIQGRTVNAQEIYSIRFWVNVAQLGYETRFKGQFSHPYIEDGVMWNRVESVSDWEGEVCPITTETHAYLTDFGQSHNCDNTLSITRGQGMAFRHTKNSNQRLGDYRSVMARIMQGESDFRKELERQLGVGVDDAQFGRFLDFFIPVNEDDLPAKKTRSERKRQEITQLYQGDPRVAAWKGTEFGVVQAVNTWNQHLSQLRNGTGVEMDDRNLRAMRNYAQRLRGNDQDLETVKLLEAVL